MHSIFYNASLVLTFITSFLGSLCFLNTCRSVAVPPPSTNKIFYHISRGLLGLLIGLIAGRYGELLLRQLPFETLEYVMLFLLVAAILLHIPQRQIFTSQSGSFSPWFYTFVFLAAIAGGMLEGGRLMVAFWLGTLPVLIRASIPPAFERRITIPYRILSAATLMILILLVVVVHRLNSLDIHYNAEVMEPILPAKCVH
jgi:hypothetical protein